MPEQLVPDSMAATIADMQRRLQVLEATSRVGLNRVRYAAGSVYASPTTFGAFEYGSAGNTWIDDLGNTGTGYPTLTTTCDKIMLCLGGRPLNIGNDLGVTWRSQSCIIAVRIDGVIRLQSLFQNINNDQVQASNFRVRVFSLGPGSHTFSFGAQWGNTWPAAPTQPLMDDALITVLPIN